MFPTTVPFIQPGQRWDNGSSLPSDPNTLSRHYDGNPMNNEQTWMNQVASFANYGLSPLQDYNKPEFDSNVAITFPRPLLPWIDKTHLQIQRNMVMFVCKKTEANYRIYSAAPIYKLNIMMQTAYNELHNQFGGGQSRDQTDFLNLLKDFGEDGITKYHQMQKIKRIDNEEWVKFVRLSNMDEFCYLTKQGILNRWSFDGVVTSKGETEEPNAYLDHIASADIVPMVGVIVGGRARVHNIWGNVRPGHRLYLVLTRVKKSDKTYGSFKIIPMFGLEKPDMYYFDESGKECKAHVFYVGIADSVMEKDPAEYNIQKALGDFMIPDGAFAAYGSLPCIDVYVGM